MIWSDLPNPKKVWILLISCVINLPRTQVYAGRSRELSASRQSSKLIGTCGFNNWVAYDHSAIIGYELAPEFWGKGYATEAIHKIISAAYNDELQIHVNRIEASVVPGNIASEKVLKKNGFIFEGRLREKAFWDNQYQDMNLFALIKSQFLKA